MQSMREGVRLLLQCAPGTTRWEVAKFCMRSACRPRLHERWLQYLGGRADRLQWARLQPALLWKLQRPYAMAGLPAAEKLRRLMDHYDWLETTWPAAPLAALRRGQPVQLASLASASGRVHGLALGFEERFAKEGELVLSMSCGAERLASLVFSVHRRDGLWAMHVGCLQGPAASDHARDAVRDATKDLCGLRPKHAVVQALCVLAGLHGVREIACVANAGHVYQHQRRRGDRVLADYDGFWHELGGVPRGALFLLPPLQQHKPVEEVPSRKRAQYRRRLQLEAALAQQVESVFEVGDDAARGPRWAA